MSITAPFNAVLMTTGTENNVLVSRKPDEVEVFCDVAAAFDWLKKLRQPTLQLAVPGSDCNIELLHEIFENRRHDRELLLIGPGDYAAPWAVTADSSRLWKNLRRANYGAHSVWRRSSEEDLGIYRLAGAFVKGRDVWLRQVPFDVPRHPLWAALSFFQPTSMVAVGFVLATLREPNPMRGSRDDDMEDSLFRTFGLARFERSSRLKPFTRDSLGAVLETVWRRCQNVGAVRFIARPFTMCKDETMRRVLVTRRFLEFLLAFWAGERHPECFVAEDFFLEDVKVRKEFDAHVARIKTASTSRLTAEESIGRMARRLRKNQ